MRCAQPPPPPRELATTQRTATPLAKSISLSKSFGFITCLGLLSRDGNTKILLTKSENNGIDDEHSHHKTAESVVQDEPLDATPPGAAGTATRRHDRHDLAGREERRGRGEHSGFSQHKRRRG